MGPTPSSLFRSGIKAPNIFLLLKFSITNIVSALSKRRVKTVTVKKTCLDDNIST